MDIITNAVAGTLESSDIQIRIEPGQNNEIKILLKSVVQKQFGNHINELIRTQLEKLGVSQCEVIAIDKGALDFAIIARLQSAVHRAAGMENEISWEEL